MPVTPPYAEHPARETEEWPWRVCPLLALEKGWQEGGVTSGNSRKVRIPSELGPWSHW
jgi:hypothetical protein